MKGFFNGKKVMYYSLREKCPYISPYSVQMWEITDQEKSEYWPFLNSDYLEVKNFL